MECSICNKNNITGFKECLECREKLMHRRNEDMYIDFFFSLARFLKYPLLITPILGTIMTIDMLCGLFIGTAFGIYITCFVFHGKFDLKLDKHKFLGYEKDGDMYTLRFSVDGTIKKYYGEGTTWRTMPEFLRIDSDKSELIYLLRDTVDRIHYEEGK